MDQNKDGRLAPDMFGWIQSATALLRELQELGKLHSPP